MSFASNDSEMIETTHTYIIPISLSYDIIVSRSVFLCRKTSQISICIFRKKEWKLSSMPCHGSSVFFHKVTAVHRLQSNGHIPV